MADRFFLDADTVSELREEGLVPLSPLSLRLARISAVLIFAAYLPWADLSKLSAPMLCILLGLPFLVVMLLGFLSTKALISSMPDRAARSRAPLVWTIFGLVLSGGTLVSVSLLLARSSRWITMVPQLLLAAMHDPAPFLRLIKSGCLSVAITAFIAAFLTAAIEYIAFHRRHRDRARRST